MSKKKYAPLRYDIVFKGFFSKEDNKNLLLSLLKNYLDLDIVNEEDIQFTNTELTPTKLDDKMPRLDLRVKLRTGESVNVEVQGNYMPFFLKRLYYYNTKMYSSQAVQGGIYGDLKKSMTLAFTYYDIFDSEFYKNHIYLYHEESQAKVLDDIHLCVIELSKYLKLKKNKRIEVDDWADLLNAKTDMAFENIKKRGGIMAEAVRKLSFFTQDEIDRYWEDMYLKAEMDENTLKAYWKEQGLAEGRSEGRVEGRKEGISIGKIEGMLTLGADIAKIMELTGVTEKEILEVKKNM